MILNGKWQPVYSMSEEKSSRGPIKKINQFQDSDTSRYIQMSNSKIHRIVKKQMGLHDKYLDKSLQVSLDQKILCKFFFSHTLKKNFSLKEKGRTSAEDINIIRDYDGELNFLKIFLNLGPKHLQNYYEFPCNGVRAIWEIGNCFKIGHVLAINGHEICNAGFDDGIII